MQPTVSYLATPEPKKKRRGLKIAAWTGFGLVMGTLVIVAAGLGTSPANHVPSMVISQYPPNVTTAPTTAGVPPQAVAEPVRVAAFEAGDYAIGNENVPGESLKPGTYRVTAGEYGCYWARVKSFDGELGSIITNGNIDGGRTATIVVKKTDKGLQLQNDCSVAVK